MNDELKPGTLFKHFKGGLYEFLSFARDSETQEELVVYKALYGTFEVWVRPKEMFFSKVRLGDNEVNRFQAQPD
jgi:hypothetical protein